MSKQKGSLFKVYAAINGVPTLLCGLQSTSATINAESVDVTDGCADGWRNLLQGAGVRSFSISGNGITRNSTAHSFLLASHIAQSHVYITLTDQLDTVYYGFMQIASIGASAAHNGAELFELSLESASITRQIPPNPFVLADEFSALLVTDLGEPIAVGA